MKTNYRITRTTLNLFVLLALLAAALGLPSSARAAAPTNDSILSPVVITSANTTIYMSDDDFNAANNGTNDPIVCGSGDAGVHTIWYTFTPSTYGKATIDTFGSNFDTVLAVWTLSGGSLQSVACNDDSASNLQSEIKNLQMKAGTKYYIEVLQYTGSSAPQKEFEVPSNPSLISNYMTLNFSFTQDLNIAVPGTKYDDKNAIFAYTGTWYNTNNAKAFAGSFKISKTVGNTASLTFDGIQVKIYFTKYTTYGTLELYLDGSDTPFHTIDQKNTTYAYQQVYVSPVFSDGIHTLRMRHGTKQVTIDAIEIVGAPDLVPPAAITNLSAAPGVAYGSVSLSWTASGDDGTDGTAKYYEVRYSTNPISDETAWNAATPVTSGLPTPKPSGETETMTVGGLAPNLTYHFAVKVFDEPAPDSTGSGVSNSASAVTGSPTPSGAGTYDDKLDAAKWVYVGTWTNTTTASAYKNSYRWAPAGGSAAFVFTGTKFTFIYVSNSAGGTVEVRVDGAVVGTINMKSSIARYNQRFVYTVPAGTHTVQFILTTGNKINVDAITIE